MTRAELSHATAELPFVSLSDEAAHDYEQEHLPEDAWPPTAEFSEWALSLHMYALEREQSPVGLRWLIFRRSADCAVAGTGT